MMNARMSVHNTGFLKGIPIAFKCLAAGSAEHFMVYFLVEYWASKREGHGFMPKRTTICVGVLLTVAGVCWADSLISNGKTFENVCIRESASMYYVQVPSDGSVFSVPKSDVPAKDVSISTDAAQREALRQEWRRNYDQRQGVTTATEQTPASDPPPVEPASGRDVRRVRAVQPSEASQPAAGTRSARISVHNTGDGYVSRVNLKNVSMDEALKATLRPMNLDYRVEDGYIWISTPEKLRQESFEKPDTRYYELKSPGADTLPKIVVRNQSAAQVTGVAGSRGQGYGQGYGSNQSAGNAGYGGGGGSGGGYRTGGNQQAMGMGYGGGMGGLGMGGMPMAPRGPQFSNIAELFSTIDDRLVGETPAIIGISGLR